jgi:glycosyltransferase involved in cell wall biosynthesis
MGDKIQVLVVTNTYPSEARPGDTPNIKDQVEDLRRLGASVDVLYIDGSRKLNYLWGALKIFSLSFTSKKYDVLHAFYGHSGALAQLQKKYPVIVTFLGSDLLSEKDSRIGQYAARKADGVIVLTDEMRTESGRDARVIPFGANAHIFKPYPKHEARLELGLPQDKKLILFPWKPTRPEKRYWLAEEAVALLDHYYDVELIAIYNMPREVVSKYMSACDALILTSRHEGSPLAVREAIACKLPVVAVDVGDVRSIVEQFNGGFIAERNAQAIAEKLSLALDSNQAFFDMSSSAYDSLSAAKQVLAFYQQMLAN